MTYGFRSISSSGYVQIDDTYSNYGLYQAGSVSSVYIDAQSPNLVVYGCGNDAVLAVQAPVGYSVFGWARASGGTLSAYVCTSPYFTTVKYRVYSKYSIFGAVSGYGMVINNSSGSRVYDTNHKVMSVSVNGIVNADYPDAAFSVDTDSYVVFHTLYDSRLEYAGFSDISNMYGMAARWDSANYVSFISELYGIGPPVASPEYYGGLRSIVIVKP